MGMNQLGGMNDSFGQMMNRGGGRGRSIDTNSIVVRNLPFSYTWQNLKEKFQDCGETLSLFYLCIQQVFVVIDDDSCL